MLKRLIPLFFLILSLSVFSQEKITSKNYIAKVLSEYSNYLKLDKSQKKKFKKVLIGYNKKLEEILNKELNLSKDSKLDFNSIVKIYDQKIFTILSSKQFENYKAFRKKIESFKNYKI